MNSFIVVLARSLSMTRLSSTSRFDQAYNISRCSFVPCPHARAAATTSLTYVVELTLFLTSYTVYRRLFRVLNAFDGGCLNRFFSNSHHELTSDGLYMTSVRVMLDVSLFHYVSASLLRHPSMA